MIVYVDVDETVCQSPEDRDYSKAVPIKKNIKKINELYYNGHMIVYWTARGTITKLKWDELTHKQLKNWGCKFHTLSVGKKPAYDLLICDKTKRIEEI